MLLLTATSHAATHYVWTNSPNPTPPYTNWHTAAHVIQVAIDEAGNNGLILVTNGVYDQGITRGGFSGYNRVALSNGCILQSVNGPLHTSIKGSPDQNGSYLGTSAIRCAFLTHNAKINGFTLTNGYERYGAGLFVDNSGTISNCIISGCSASSCIALFGEYNHCTFTGNTCDHGPAGAIQAKLTSCIFSNNQGKAANDCELANCLISDNVGEWTGGATDSILRDCVIIRNRTTDTIFPNAGGVAGCTLYNCYLIDNECPNAGGARESTLYNCIIYNNRADVGGGAYLCTLINCVVAENHATYVGGGVVFANIRNCIVWSNTAGVSHPDIYTNLPGFTFVEQNNCSSDTTHGQNGNITNNPMFADTDAGNFFLRSTSPCIDTGMNILGEDFLGIPRPLDGNNDGIEQSDMGAYEFVSMFVDTDGDGMKDRAEATAGTNIKDPSSYLGMRQIKRSSSNNQFTITWSSATGRHYRLMYNMNLPKGIFLPISTNITATPPTNTITVMPSDLPRPCLYRIELE